MILWIIVGVMFLFIYGILSVPVIFYYAEFTDWEFDDYDDERAIAYSIFWPVLVGVMAWAGIKWLAVAIPRSFNATFRSFGVSLADLKDKLITKE